MTTDRERLELWLPALDRELLERAAAAAGQSLTEFALQDPVVRAKRIVDARDERDA